MPTKDPEKIKAKQRRYEAKRAQRFLNWVFILYPDSAPDGWDHLLDDMHIQILISPLHTDLNPDNTEKKPHHHVIMMFDSVKSHEQLREITDALNCPHAQPVNSLRGHARYLCHLDNPEKKQYEPSEVRALGGVDYLSLISLASDKYEAIGEMIDWVVENHIVSYADLLEYSRLHNPGWFRCLCDSSSMVMIEFIKSYTWKLERGSEV